MKLHSYWRSSCSYRVRIALHHKGLDFEYIPVNLVQAGGQQLMAPYRALNPMAQVPLLEVEDGGRTALIAQSLAIIEYVEERWPEPRLLPQDRLARARARQLAEIVNSGIQPLQNLLVLGDIEARGFDRDAWAAKYIALGLAALESTAAGSSGTFLVGNEVSVADACLVPQLYNARRWCVDLQPFPTLCRVEAACVGLPSFRRAHPDVQPDAPAPR
jgi:maleylpyruvate isomerase